ncbi:uncharacterized protein VTP21DRAFT_8012 [Calcarisporiella thermophila]|uniref:uncharacterized protein n=1 Tax=Calcarisporiella thermophila TaxID=911321 RepID=UPI0037449F86
MRGSSQQSDIDDWASERTVADAQLDKGLKLILQAFDAFHQRHAQLLDDLAHYKRLASQGSKEIAVLEARVKDLEGTLAKEREERREEKQKLLYECRSLKEETGHLHSFRKSVVEMIQSENPINIDNSTTSIDTKLSLTDLSLEETNPNNAHSPSNIPNESTKKPVALHRSLDSASSYGVRRPKSITITTPSIIRTSSLERPTSRTIIPPLARQRRGDNLYQRATSFDEKHLLLHPELSFESNKEFSSQQEDPCQHYTRSTSLVNRLKRSSSRNNIEHDPTSNNSSPPMEYKFLSSQPHRHSMPASIASRIARARSTEGVVPRSAFTMLYKRIRDNLSVEKFAEFAKVVSAFNASLATADETVEAVEIILQNPELSVEFRSLVEQALGTRLATSVES